MSKYDFYLAEIPISQIERNPDNPRGDKDEIRLNDEQFQYLKNSIEKFGLIVPIIVQKLGNNRYRLLDGERRYMALKESGKQKVRANVLKTRIKSKTAKNVMFHIHSNRLAWGPFQQCRALEPLYTDLVLQYSNDENKIAKQLAIMLGAHKRTINNRLDFLRWPRSVKRRVYSDRQDLYWTVVEIETGIIKPALKNFPNYFEKVSVNKVRKFLFNKYIEGYIRASTEARKVKFIMKTPKRSKRQYKSAKTIFKKLVSKIEYTFDDAREEFLALYPAAEEMYKMSHKKIKNLMLKLVNMFKDYDYSLLETMTKKEKSDFESIIQDLEQLLSDLRETGFRQ